MAEGRAVVHSRIVSRRAFEHFGAGQDEKARDGFTAALAISSNNGQAWLGLGVLCWKAEEYDEALDLIDRGIRQGYDTEKARLYRARCNYLACLYDDAIDDYTQVLDADPGCFEALWRRGHSLWCVNDNHAAIRDLTAALAQQDDAWVFHIRSRAWWDLEEEAKSLADLRASAKATQPIAWAHWLHDRAAHWLNFEGRQNEALADFRRAVELEPKEIRHYAARAELLLELGREKDAEADFAKIDEIEREQEGAVAENRVLIHPLVLEHLNETPLDQMEVTVRGWPARVAPDLQCALDGLAEAGFEVVFFFAATHCGRSVDDFQTLYTRDRRNPVVAAPPQYLEFDIGEAEPVRALRHGLWLLKKDGAAFVVLMNPDGYGNPQLQTAVLRGAEGLKAVHAFFGHIEAAISRSRCYRGKVLSLEYREMYNGQGQGIQVHKLRTVERDNVILPRRTLEMLERNVVQFVAQRPHLAKFGLAVKKGLLFYGPPGTGKTHTIHYLAQSLPGHTTFVIAAEQVGNLADYMELARLLQPAMVVIEDVDLIARERETMRSAGEETLLNRLLNEMDGLQADAEIVFVLTTNRPGSLEDALASRPGRIDQAIEFPLPDAEGRAKLAKLYSQVPITEAALKVTVERTEKVSASFIKELMRRAIQFALERGTAGLEIRPADVERSLDELLVAGGPLNRKILGAGARDARVE